MCLGDNLTGECFVTKDGDVVKDGILNGHGREIKGYMPCQQLRSEPNPGDPGEGQRIQSLKFERIIDTYGSPTTNDMTDGYTDMGTMQ